MKPGKFKSNEIELVHTLSIPVFTAEIIKSFDSL
jgi:hypothetical protein